MPNFVLKKYLGIKEVGSLEERQFDKHPVTYFDFFNFEIKSAQLITFKPYIKMIESGWIIDGKFVISDDGFLLGEGFNWSVPAMGYAIIQNNEKFKIKAHPENLSVVGLKTDEGVPVNTIREVDDEVVTNSIFLSGFSNLSHFMMEIAPKTLLLPILLPRYPNIKTVTSCDLIPKKWIEYCIKISDSITTTKSNIAINHIKSNKVTRFKNLMVISSTTYKDDNQQINMSVNQAKYFSRLMCKNATLINNQDPYILYLSRKNASHRKTINQENLLVVVKKVFPSLNLIVEDSIDSLAMEDQAKLIYNASLIIEEGGGSTGFVSNLINPNVPYVTIQTAQRSLDAARLYLAGLSKYAAWVSGVPVGKLTKSLVIDNDIKVNENEFEDLLIRLSLFINKKIPMPKMEKKFDTTMQKRK